MPLTRIVSQLTRILNEEAGEDKLENEPIYLQ